VRSKGRPFYDYAFFIESVSEWDCEPEQGNVYDRLFAQTGFYDVPDRFKTPVFAITQGDRDMYQDWVAQVKAIHSIDLSRGYIFYQLRATNKERTVPLAQQNILLSELDQLGLPIICADDMPLEREVSDMLHCHKNAHDVSRRINNVRLFGVLIANSTLTVAPDSLATHFAAAARVPCLSVWGPFDPESRIKYYANQIGLAHSERCANAFCHNHMDTLPLHLCPRGAEQKTCECYEGITSAEVREAISSLLHQKNAKMAA
jgi:ADP-heptose:LPS heptosyltransferase